MFQPYPITASYDRVTSAISVLKEKNYCYHYCFFYFLYIAYISTMIKTKVSMKHRVRIAIRHKIIWTSLLCLWWHTPVLQANNEKPVSVVMTLQEAIILQQLLQQVEVNTQEMSTFLALQKPIDRLIERQPEDVGIDKKIKLVLPPQGPQDLLIFLQRVTIRGAGTQQVNALTKKIQRRLPKDSPLQPAKPTKDKQITFPMTAQEARLFLQLLQQIDIGVPEMKAFLALSLPMEQALKGVEDPHVELLLKWPLQAPQNLLVFMQRFSIVGGQVQSIHNVMERLQQLAQPDP